MLLLLLLLPTTNPLSMHDSSTDCDIAASEVASILQAAASTGPLLLCIIGSNSFPTPPRPSFAASHDTVVRLSTECCAKPSS